MAAMAEAAAPAVSVRSSSVASIPLTITRGSPSASSLEVDLGVEGAADQGRGVGQVEVGPAGGDADGAVQRAGIEVMPAQALGHVAADGALAGAGGAVDGEDGDGWNGRTWAFAVMAPIEAVARNHLIRPKKLPARMRGFVFPVHF